MKTKELQTIATVALGTAGLTVLGLWPGALDAGNEAALPLEIARPALQNHGVEMTITTADGRVPAAGESPVFELKARSLTNATVSVCVQIAMVASSPADALSRAVRLPSVLWQDQRLFTVEPGETKVIRLVSAASLPMNQMISVLLREGDPARPLTAAAGARWLPAQAGGSPGISALDFSTVVSRAGLAASR